MTVTNIKQSRSLKYGRRIFRKLFDLLVMIYQACDEVLVIEFGMVRLIEPNSDITYKAIKNLKSLSISTTIKTFGPITALNKHYTVGVYTTSSLIY